MAIKLAGPVESQRTDRGDYAVTVKGIEIFYCDLDSEADYMVNFLSSFSIFHQLTSAAFGVVRRIRQLRDDRVALSGRVVDVDALERAREDDPQTKAAQELGYDRPKCAYYEECPQADVCVDGCRGPEGAERSIE